MATGQDQDLYIFDFESFGDDQITDQEDNDEVSCFTDRQSESESESIDDQPPALPFVKNNTSTSATMSATTSASVQCEHSHLADHNNVNDNDPDHEFLSSSQLANEQSAQQSNQLVLQELKKVSQTLQKMQRRLTSTEENVKNM